MGSQRVGYDLVSMHTHTHIVVQMKKVRLSEVKPHMQDSKADRARI